MLEMVIVRLASKTTSSTDGKCSRTPTSTGERRKKNGHLGGGNCSCRQKRPASRGRKEEQKRCHYRIWREVKSSGSKRWRQAQKDDEENMMLKEQLRAEIWGGTCRL
ncbi:Xyloglucan endotransglucosylase/hydrolase [Psidium guajava]|nr:Xyloglucan endotransglucosylase/hydrolase [Psidium guajava]